MTNLQKDGLSPSSCNKYLIMLRHAFNLSINEWSLLEKNPCDGIKKFKENPEHDYYLREEDLPKFVNHLKHDRNQMVASVILFALATGARQGEILGCSWSDISLIDKMWRIPKEHSKSGKYRMVPLSDFAIQTLENITPKHN
ncbi:MAG: tyrosine-type recombinase/integrase, partial [Gammaproteobacteria bacterium]|nr:tyrosine-type recombinase/integrase [Gammaproteobacteria bacterium]